MEIAALEMGHAGADLCLLGKDKRGVNESCSKLVNLIPWHYDKGISIFSGPEVVKREITSVL